jgi:glycosyltransferase involved in cell wall biosynthesis
MKILFVHDHRFEIRSGLAYSPGKLPYSVLKRYTEFGRLTVIGRNGSYNLSDTLELSSGANVDIIVVKNLKHQNLLRFVWTSFQIIRENVRVSDILILRMPAVLAIVAYALSLYYKKPCLVEVVLCPLDTVSSKKAFWKKFLLIISGQIMRYMVKKSFAVSYVTDTYLQAKYPSKSDLQIALSDVELHEFSKPQTFQRNHKGQHIFGMLVDYNSDIKGIDVALKAMKLMVAENAKSNFKLIIAGPGKKERWRSLAHDLELGTELVDFRGPLDRGEVIRFLQFTVDYYLQPSFSEGLPRVVVEAIASGNVCIGSSVGGIPQLIAEDWLFKAGDYKALSILMKNAVLLSDMDYAKFSEKNHEKSLCFSGSRLEAKRTSFFKKVFIDGR